MRVNVFFYTCIRDELLNTHVVAVHPHAHVYVSAVSLWDFLCEPHVCVWECMGYAYTYYLACTHHLACVCIQRGTA